MFSVEFKELSSKPVCGFGVYNAQLRPGQFCTTVVTLVMSMGSTGDTYRAYDRALGHLLLRWMTLD